MENLFTRNEIINFKIIGWAISLTTGLASGFISIWLFYKSKEETGKLEKRLERETIARKNSEKKIAEANAEKWNFLYKQEREIREKHCEGVNRREEEILNLRNQLHEKGVPSEKHDISDKRRRKEAIHDVIKHWNAKSKNGKINRKTITEVLWENWEKVFDAKEGEDIIKERDRLIRIIFDAASKNN